MLRRWIRRTYAAAAATAAVAALVLTVWSAGVATGQDATTREKVTEWYISNRPMTPPETLEATFAASHAVLRATIVDAKTVLTPGRPDEKFPTLRVYYSARVEEAFKAHDSFADGRPLAIARDGGEYREGTQVWRAINSEPVLVPGKEYILFLYWRNDEQAFRPYFGPEMMVELQQDKATRLARGATTFELPASTTELVSELRTISKRHARR
jgi:hypothetical protein